MNSKDQEITKKSKYLLITAASFFDLDKLGSTVVLAKLLSQSKVAKVDIHLDIQKPPKELAEIVAPTGVSFVEKLTSKYFTVTLDRGDAKVNEVRWEEKDDKLRILIFTEKGKVDTQEYSTSPGQPHYDELFSVGIRTEEKVLETLGEFSGLWNASKTTNVDVSGGNKRFGQVNIVEPNFNSYAELVLDYANKQEIELSGEIATELLSLIYWKTNSFRNRYARAETFDSVKQLLNYGASLETAVSKVFSSLSFIEVKARQEAFDNLRQTSNGLAISRISKQTATNLKNVNPINPNKNPLVVSKTAKASFVLVPISDSQTLVLCSAPKLGFRLKQVFSKHSFSGDDYQGEFVVKADLESTEEIIKKEMEKRLTEADATPTPKTITEKEPKRETTRKQSAPTPKPKQKVGSEKLQSKVFDPLAPATDPVQIKDEKSEGDASDSNSSGFKIGPSAADPLPSAGN